MMTAASIAAAKLAADLVIAGADSSPILEAAEYALDEIALSIGCLVERMMSLAGWIVRDDRNHAAFEKKATQTIAVISRVGGPATAPRNSADQCCRDSNVAEMAKRHFDGDGASARVDDGVNFRGAAAPRAANRLCLGAPFPPAAEWFALAVVLSMARLSPRLTRASAARAFSI